MAAPTLADGISRALKVIAVPSIALAVSVAVIREAYGGQEAGMAYIAITAFILAGIYSAAKYWNVKYTLGFATAGLVFWFGVPGVIPHLVPPVFAEMGSMLVLVFLILTGLMIFDKIG